MISISWDLFSTRTAVEGGDTLETDSGILLLDGTVSERYEVFSEATEHPIERGAAVSDHVRPLLKRLTLECIVAAEPTNVVLQLDENRPTLVRDEIDRLIREGIPVEIETSVGLFQSFLLLGRSESRDWSSGDGLRFSLEARELRIVETETVSAPAPRIERVRPSVARGRARDEDEDDEEEVSNEATQRSAALALTNLLSQELLGRRSQNNRSGN